MGMAEHDASRRAIAVAVSKAMTDADRFERKLQDSPFWRFRRRQDLGRALASARRREQAALSLLKEEQ